MSPGGIVALLFTDLVGSTTMYDRLGDVVAERLRREHFALLREHVEAHGGTEVKSVGDGLMVVFSSAIDALESAVAMQRAADARNRATQDDPLEVRVGINVGEPLRDDADFFGLSVNTARRLCDAARPGQILSSSLVRALAAPRATFTFSPVGALALKGISEPVDSFEVVWVPPSSAEPRRELPPSLLVRDGPPFVGRRSEHDALLSLWKRAVAGDRLVALVSGEPGIGKTRIVAEVARIAAEQGHVLAGRTDPELTVAYQPFTEALERHVRAPTPAVSEILQAYPDLRVLFADVSQSASPSVADEGRGPRLLAGVSRLLEALGAGEPVLLVLDDMHWADDATLLLVRHLIRSASEQPLLIVLTYRDTDVHRGHPFADLVADLRTDPVATRVPLRGITAAAVREMMGGATSPAVDELSTRISEETSGNPFFVREVLLHLQEAGSVRYLDGAYDVLEPVARLGVPEGVREVLGRRLTRLSPRCNDLLATASVAGRTFDLTALARVEGVRPIEALEALEEARLAGLLTAEGGADHAYTFSHALVRETLYDELAPARRMRMHAALAAALIEEQRTPPEIAHHLIEAGLAAEPLQVGAWALLAANIAMTLLGADDDAVSFAEAGLEALGETTDHPLVIDLLTVLADARFASWRPADGVGPIRRAIAMARRMEDGGRYTHAATVFVRSAAEATPEHNDELLAAVPPNAPPIAVVRLRCAMTLDFAVPRREVQAALAEAEAANDTEAITYSALALADRLSGEGRFDEAVAVMESERARAVGWVGYVTVPITARLVHAHLGAGDRVRADNVMAALIASPFGVLADATGQQLLMRGMLALLDVDLDEAERAARQAMSDLPGVALPAGGLLMSVAFERGLAHEVLPLMVEMSNDSPGWRAGIALFAAETGDTDLCRRASNGVVEAARTDRLQGIALGLLADAAHSSNDRDLARLVLDDLDPLRGGHLVAEAYLSLGAADRYAGLCELTLGRTEAGLRSLRDAVELNDCMPAPLWSGHARADIALALENLGDAEGAKASALEALTGVGAAPSPRLAQRVAHLVG